MTGSAMQMKNRILAMVVGMACNCAAFAAPPPQSSAPSSAPTSAAAAAAAAKAKAIGAQVEAALAGADSGAPASPPAPGSPAVAGAPAGAAPAGSPVTATAPPAAADTRSLDEDTQQLKKDVVDLNRDLFVLEEELLFPANTQVAVFVSMDVGDFFALDSITLKIDNREVGALIKGGVQRLYVGNLKSGQHELVAFFNGKGPNDRSYRRAANIRFEKGVGAKYLELKVTDHQRAQQPEFEIKDWE